jgi:saccharopine dehydrogenase (NAD+, L-lysine-forming)
MIEEDNRCGMKSLLLLGATGNTGRLLAELLLQETKAHLLLGSRDQGRAQALAGALNGRFPNRTTAVALDAADPASLRIPFTRADMVVVVSSTVQYARCVAETALAAGCDYFDIQIAAEKNRVLHELAPQIEAAGRLFITDGGFHPGLPAAMVRYAAPQFDTLQSARVGSVIKIDWSSLEFSRETLAEFAGEFADFHMRDFKDGRWRDYSTWAMINPPQMEFGMPFAGQAVMPMVLEEMEALPALFPSLEDAGFYVGGFNPITDWIVAPVVVAGLRLAPQRGRQALGDLFSWSLRTFSRPPYGTRLKLEARGLRDGRDAAFNLLISHVDGYALTAIAAAACVLQMLGGQIERPGLCLQALAVQPKPFIADLARLGAVVSTTDSY